MKRFIQQSSIMLAIIIVSIGATLSLADGTSDPYYLKLSSPKQQHLILGTSKAAQGIQPKIIGSILNCNIYNYAFTMQHSPYGDVYLNSIQQKIDTTTQSGIFILTIDPWSLSSLNGSRTDAFRENASFLNDITNVNVKPNYSYLFNHFSDKYLNIIYPQSPAFVHNDGWLEVSLDIDQLSINRRTKFTLDDYEEKLGQYQFSEERYVSLNQTIDFLKQFGDVYLVCLPVHPDLMQIEIQLMPDFNTTIHSAIQSTSGYLDFRPNNMEYTYTDGVHLDKVSGAIVSRRISEWILEQRDRNNKNSK